MPTSDGHPGASLPAALTSFVGRRGELDEIRRLLSGSRLVTLTGVGGTGKTRLAAHLGARLRRAFADGVWWIDLTQLQAPGLLRENIPDPDELAFLVTATVGLREQDRDGEPLRMLAEHIADRQMLLILDNCEHLPPVAGIFTSALLGSCPRLRVLATSREPLQVTGEMLYSVPPLPTPDARRPASVADLPRYESVALFLTRAEAAMPGFRLTEDNHLAIAQLCHRLDGLPLAIELAAATVRVLTPTQILDRLTDRFKLLSRGSRGAPERQQTLRASVEWSFDLCAKPERTLWARLSVFTGGFDLDAVEGICADEKVPETELLDLIGGLVDKSVVVRDDGQEVRGDTAGYRMLDTIREYGRDKLREAGEELVLRRRHRDWYQEWVARGSTEWVSRRGPYWMARLTRAHANLRSAVEFSLTESGEAETALRLAVSLPPFYWWARGLFGEGRHWLDSALARAVAPSILRARGLLAGSQLAFWQGDARAGMHLLNEGESLARQLDASPQLAHAAFLRGLAALYANDVPAAVDALTHTRTTLSGKPDVDPDLYLNVLLALASAAALAGDPDTAGACQQEALAIAGPGGGSRTEFFALFAGGIIAWTRGELARSTSQAVECLRLGRAWEPAPEPDPGVALCLELLAWIAAAQQRHQRAATLLGAADAFWTDSDTSVTAFGHYIDYHRSSEQLTRQALGDTAFTDAFHHGRALTYDGAIGYALDEPPQATPTARTPVPTTLTRREQQVADLITDGLSNKQIAERLVISQRTVESHVEHILVKFACTNRAEVAARIAEHRSVG